jgi:valyl-tRNA synthetase
LTRTEAAFAINWFENRLNQVSVEVDELMTQFKLSEALKTIYSLIWDDFCSWYLEWAKPGFEQPVDPKVYHKTIEFFEKLMELLHPIMPFITEEIFHLLKEQKEDLTVKLQGKPNPADETILAAGSLLKDVITKLRDARNKNQLKPKDPVVLHIMAENTNGYKAIESPF